MVFEVAVAISAISCWLRTVKSSSLPGRDVMALAQQIRDLLLHRSSALQGFGRLHDDAVRSVVTRCNRFIALV